MPDLDFSNVHADARVNYDDMLHRLFVTLDRHDVPTLERLRYKMRVEAQSGFPFDVDSLRMIETILLSRLVTTLCEGCLGRTGCDMCNPPDYSYLDDYGFDRQTAHFERFGRPEFPNEY